MDVLDERPELYKINERSQRASLAERPSWPPMRIYVYPENRTHTLNCLYEGMFPTRYVKRVSMWFQRMLEPVVHHQLLNCPIRTENPEDADLYFIPHYSRMCSGEFGSTIWDGIPEYVNRYGRFYGRYGTVDHVIMHSVPRYGDKPADTAMDNQKGPIIAILDLNPRKSRNFPWTVSRALTVPFITRNVEDAFQTKRNTSLFVLMSTSTKGLRAGSARLRQDMESVMTNVRNSLVSVINRTHLPRFRAAMKKLPYWMSHSDMCLVPPGDAPSSKRFYDAIQNYCIPYILSDKFFFPYEDIYVEYEGIVKQLPSAMVANMSDDINNLDQETVRRMRKNIVNVKERFTWNYEEYPKTGQALWTMTWALFDKSRMLKPYQNNEMTGNDIDV